MFYKDFLAPSKGDSTKPEKMSDKERKRLDRKVMRYISEWLGDLLFHHMSTMKLAHTNYKLLWGVSLSKKL